MDPYAQRIRQELRALEDRLERTKEESDYYQHIVTTAKQDRLRYKRAIRALIQLGREKAHIRARIEELLQQVF